MAVSFFAWGASGFMGEALRRLMDERLSQGSRDALGTSTRRTTGVAFFAMGIAFLAASLRVRLQRALQSLRSRARSGWHAWRGARWGQVRHASPSLRSRA